MCVGFSRYLADTSCERIRVGFVCEALIQFMPLIGWYRKLVAKDIFVWRSFKQDSPTIKKNIDDFHTANENRMLFLSPEGVVVDFGPKDVEYINACRKFCVDQSYKPFDYVLTPRYKVCLWKKMLQYCIFSYAYATFRFLCLPNRAQCVFCSRCRSLRGR